MSNSFDPDQLRFVWPDLGPKCLQKLSENDTRGDKELNKVQTHK